MFDKFKAIKRGKLAYKAGVTLTQRLLQYFFDRGITPSNEDNFFFNRECCTLAACLTGLHYSNNIFEEYEHIFDISTMAISLTTDYIKDVLSKSGVQPELIAQLSQNLNSTTFLEQKSAEWFLFLRTSFPEGYSRKEEVFNAAIGLFAGRIEIWREFDSELPFPDDLENWIRRIVLSEIDKYGLLPELTEELKS